MPDFVCLQTDDEQDELLELHTEANRLEVEIERLEWGLNVLIGGRSTSWNLASTTRKTCESVATTPGRKSKRSGHGSTVSSNRLSGNSTTTWNRC